MSNEKTQYDEATKSTMPASEQTTPKSTMAWGKVSAGLGMGLLLGSVSSFTATKATANNEMPMEEDDVEPNYEQPAWADDEVHVATSVNDDMSFSEAFAAARAEVGAGGAFEWHGNVYGTYLADEWNNMSAEERAEYGSHFNWNNHANSREQVVESNDDIEILDSEVVAPAEVEVADDDSGEVEILGVVHDSETGANYGGMIIDGQEVVLIDVDGEGTFYYAISDLNHDGQITEDEVADISEQQITVEQFENSMREQHFGEVSTDEGPDYINETPENHDMV